MRYIKGPDFPTGGVVINKDELAEIYKSGTGKIKLRAKWISRKERPERQMWS